MARNFVDNKELCKELCLWRDSVKEAELLGQPRPHVSEYIGTCIYLIATNLSMKNNFRMYSYLDDMVGSACLNAILYLDRFNPEKSTNPFAWLTQVTHNCFIRLIEKEKGYTYGKLKILEAKLAAEPSKRRDNRDSERNLEIIAAFEAKERNKKDRLEMRQREREKVAV